MATKIIDKGFENSQIIPISETLRSLSDTTWTELGREPWIHEIAVVMARTVAEARENALWEGYDDGYDDGYNVGSYDDLY